MNDSIYADLALLSRAVAYANLSAAANQMRISQPQLSRLVARIEEVVGTPILDRTIRRKSSWTPMAFKLSEAFSVFSKRLSSEIEQATLSGIPSHLRVGTLEGLSPITLQWAHSLSKETQLKTIEINVYDLSDLERLFTKNELDVVFTMREPGKKHFTRSRLLGHQTFENFSDKDSIEVLSTFEFHSRKELNPKLENKRKFLVSNSLDIRRQWLTQYGGKGVIPSKVARTQSPDRTTHPVMFLCSDLLGEPFWKTLCANLPFRS